MKKRLQAFAWLLGFTLSLPFLLNHFSEFVSAHHEPQQPTMDTWGPKELAFVVDTTSGMDPAISALLSAFDNAEAWNRMTDTFQLVQFRDTAMVVGETNNREELETWLAALDPNGGGDCVDNALAGLLAMAGELDNDVTPPTELLLATDATPLGDRAAYAYVAERMTRRGAQVTVLLHGWCPGAEISEVGLGFLSIATGGRLIQTTPGDYEADATIAFLLMDNEDTILQILDEVTAGEPKIYPLNFGGGILQAGVEDDYYDCLTCILRLPMMDGAAMAPPTDITVELIDPDGNVIGMSDPNYISITTAFQRYQSLDGAGAALDPDEWKIRVTGEGQYSLNVVAQSDLHLNYFGRHSVPAGRPFPIRAALLHDQFPNMNVYSDLTWQLVSMDGTEVVPIELFDDGNHHDGAADDGQFGGLASASVQGCYLLTVEGTLNNGDKFRRQFPVPIRVRGFDLPDPNGSAALPDSTQTVRFTLENEDGNGAGTPTTFDLALFSENGWALSSDVPVSITLAAGESTTFNVELTIPNDAAIGTMEEISLVAAPREDIGLSATATAEIEIVDELYYYLPSAVNQQ